MAKVQKNIVYTRFEDGGISILCPSGKALRAMQYGGFYSDQPHGFIDAQITRQIKDGIDPDHAAKFTKALAFGGCTEAEAYEIIKNRDAAKYGHLFEILHRKDTPDRWFRDAWRRSANGGPIGIDLDKAKPIQWDKLKRHVDKENKVRENSFDPAALIKAPWETIRSAIRHARDEDELRKIWIN